MHSAFSLDWRYLEMILYNCKNSRARNFYSTKLDVFFIRFQFAILLVLRMNLKPDSSAFFANRQEWNFIWQVGLIFVYYYKVHFQSPVLELSKMHGIFYSKYSKYSLYLTEVFDCYFCDGYGTSLETFQITFLR